MTLLCTDRQTAFAVDVRSTKQAYAQTQSMMDVHGAGRGGRGDRGGRGGGRGRGDFKPKMRIAAGASGPGQNKKQTFDD